MLQKSDNDAVVVAACRTPVGKMGGALSQIRPDDLGAVVIKELLYKTPYLDPFLVDDVIFGCAIPEDVQGMNVARITSLLAGLPVSVPGMTINRFCSSGLQAISLGADRIRSGGAEVIIAGGVESMSMVPMQKLEKVPPNPKLLQIEPGSYITTIGGAEVLRKKYGISRLEQDEFALESHKKAIQAQDAGKFKEEIIPLKISVLIETVEVAASGAKGEKETKEIMFDHDEGPRRNSSLEKLEKLAPAMQKHDPNSTVTAGNASQMSDGAAAVLLMSRRFARRLNIKPLARLVDYMVTGVKPEFFGIGPVSAIRAILGRNWCRLEDIGLIELNEAFAVQVLAVLQRMQWLNKNILNVNGGAIALGHPLGCSGARIATTLIHEMRRRGVELGLETMCIGGGMGAAAIFQLED